LANADLKYASVVQDISMPGYIAFVNKTMVDTAHSLGMEVVPWTVKYVPPLDPVLRAVLTVCSRLNVVEYLLSLGVDGIITDYPQDVRTLLERKNLPLAPKANATRVMRCLDKFVQLTAKDLDNKGY
jgi:glycerophosphoryl diester phosphodiesterase